MNKKAGYSRPQVLLHWLSALIIVWALASGFYVALGDVSAATKNWIGFINVSVTTLYIPFFMARLYFLFAHGRPLPPGHGVLTGRLASAMHLALYVVVAVVLITGILMMDRPINIFDVVFIVQPPIRPQWAASFQVVHVQACVVLSVLVALHVAAVIKHEVSGERIIKRMSL
ncbi:cytochrome b/b6 domain-containing protein [Pseudomonas sp. N3-W]|jgi:cytochrome b561|uniref:Cytochrome b/b6 domain-containing protein n=1 Tax=Pseudomonas fungipugnans TaxID=3024217 RepID=A0ABT6QT14_9PSED|nr:MULTISPECIES: cytochrome b/b6 domain-containing protein [unclassified Pseudomonas]MDI2593342.1 cytochrome b/b6 domain-containing protein [Pseudomonas sp. 681]UWF49787.1 cytochrome b/b6 domain-containing protein [Pseudomonas sp. N3-W]